MYEYMSIRVTILDDDLASALRKKQAQLINERKTAVSFSFVINQQLRKSLKK